MAKSVREITREAPNIIRLCLRDSPIVKGNIVNLGTPDAGSLHSIVQRTNPRSGALEWCIIIDRQRALKFFDTMPSAGDFYDRAALKLPGKYPTLGGMTPVSVHAIIKPYDQGDCYPSGSNIKQVAMEHQYYIVYSGNIPDGSYTFDHDDGAFAATSLIISNTTPCRAIHNTQIGNRPTDGAKYAYVSLWVPGYGTEGQMDLASLYGISSFNIIDKNGAVVFTGSVSLMANPTMVEGTAPLITYASSTTPPKVITGMTLANPSVVTIPGHGYVNGQQKIFRCINGLDSADSGVSSQVEQLLITVANATTDTFEATGANGVGLSAFVNGGTYYKAGYNNLCYDTHLANRAATYVYLLNFSAFAPTAYGMYRIQVPGFGVGYEFRIDPAIHYETARACAKGLYNTCYGIPLSAAYGGMERAAGHRDGYRGFNVFKSTLPVTWEPEMGTSTTMIATGSGGISPWVTTEHATDYFGHISDAGDWDEHIGRHAYILWYGLTFGYKHLPTISRDTNFGWPRASATWDYTNIYDGIDAMPDIIHIVLHYLEQYRRFQHPDGYVHGGHNYVLGGSYTGNPGGGSIHEPSHLTSYDMHLLAGDYTTNYSYAWVAFRLAEIFLTAGHTTLGNIWKDSAIAAYAWAETIYQDYKISGIAGAAWVDYYITTLDVKTKSGKTDAQLTAHYNSLQSSTTTGGRQVAAATAWNCTHNPYYEAIYKETIFGGHHAFAAWDYGNDPLSDPTHGAYYNARWDITFNTVSSNCVLGAVSYRAVVGNAAYLWAPTTTQYLPMQVLGEGPKTESNSYLKLIHANDDFYHGANQENLCSPTGMGVPNPIPVILSRDRQALGVETPDMIGAYLLNNWYMNSGPGGPHGGFIFRNLHAAGDDSAGNYTTNQPTSANDATNGFAKLYEPFARSFPFAQSHCANTEYIYHAEGGFPNQMYPYVSSLFRHAWDSNTVTELTDLEDPPPEPGVPVIANFGLQM